jgi:hypothetical protein
MNSDPYDSAAWRTFGMLDADESAIFDEAMRHDPVLRSAYLEMDRLSAAIGAASVAPIEPRAGQLERLQNRLGLYPVRRLHVWMGLSGWAAAAALALLMVFTRGGHTNNNSGTVSHQGPPPEAGSNPALMPAEIAASPGATAANEAPAGETAAEAAANESTRLAAAEEAAKVHVKVETKRLIQEIEVLRDNLEKFQQRDRILFEAVPGVAVPIVMTMRPPGEDSDGEIIIAQQDAQGSITGMLGDALKLIHGDGKARTTTNLQEFDASTAGEDASTSSLAGAVVPGITAFDPSASLAPPSAIPIYDAARDTGTLVVNNLPEAGDGNVYNLWVHTVDGKTPIYVGSLPEGSTNGTDSFDFSLGSTKVLPSGFVLTKDQNNQPSTPSASNTVLQGPTTADR